MANLVNAVRETVREHPDDPAIVTDDGTLTYQELWERIGGFAAGLTERGVGVDDRVALYLPNVPQFVVAFHGTLRAGGVVVPMNPQYRAREISHLLADSGARVVVTLPDLVPFVDEVREDTDVEHVASVGDGGFEEFLGEGDPEIAERADDDLAVQPYTSGTTGTPKGVRLTHHNLASNAAAAADLIPGGIGPDDSQLGVLPLFHIYGMTVCMNATLFRGGTFYPLPSWDAQRALSLVEDAELTLMHGVPAMYNDVINQPNAEEFDLSSIRLAGVGGGGIPIEVLRRFEELYDAKIYEGYGLTETSPVTHFNTPDDGRRVGSIGRTVPGVSSRVVDDDFEELPPVEEGPLAEDDAELDDVTGEIVVAGANVMLGYAGLPEATEEAFTEADGERWFHTGDIGYWDEDGFFYVVDRKKHMINTAGYNVYPREVEELLFEHEAVADAAVIGVPDERRNETVKAVIVPVPDADVTADEIREYCLDNLAAYKHPREVAFVEELPRTTTGKVQKFELREQS
ncbi:long-chain-fatty-acid--CoA ligase [Haladaptatus salinisoli]|uniref:long-chain-fatty-acid--CoA ligase n=1 Tax=Haladaptatus salinisoli TaxID=2884876 RepID=UPI001D0AD4DA|nr:long-chain fatty acid--CoA ligase [Haladaptatus salinisoli]